ncbi:MAG: hypothetical protein HW405_514 [Candidatus Berkelbacteria bacterium]|nr:hypothetical protein [Candidatus Berkelbacteria bacterium]
MIDVSDPNHQTEVYYGRPGLYNIDDMTLDLGIRIYPEDKTQVFPDPSLGIGSKITIQRAMPIIVDDAGKITIIRTWQKQVGEVFSEQKIELGDKDKIDPSKDSWLRPNMKIVVTRVAETEIKETETVAYKTISKNDPNMDKGESRVEQAGKNGTKVKTYLVTRENGVEVSRKLTNEEVTAESQDKIIYVGTRVVILGRGNATWYDLISGMTAAHNTLPRYSYVRVTAVNSGKSIV